MRKITAVEFVSLDGVAEAPEVWTPPYFNEEMLEIAQGGMDQADAMLLGRRTYEDFAAYWPKQPREAPFAAWTNDTHKYVVSTTLTSLEFGPVFLAGTWLHGVEDKRPDHSFLGVKVGYV